MKKSRRRKREKSALFILRLNVFLELKLTSISRLYLLLRTLVCNEDCVKVHNKNGVKKNYKAHSASNVLGTQ